MRSAFIAYVGDCRVSGQIEAESDEPDAHAQPHSEITIHQAQLSSHTDGHTVELDEITLERIDLFAIAATDAPSNRSRRLHTVRHRMEIQLGPYAVLGHLHTLPGGRPLVTIGQRSQNDPVDECHDRIRRRIARRCRGRRDVDHQPRPRDMGHADASELAAIGNLPTLQGSRG